MDGEESLCGKALVPVSDNELLQGISLLTTYAAASNAGTVAIATLLLADCGYCSDSPSCRCWMEKKRTWRIR
jgi:hypothetical protein